MEQRIWFEQLADGNSSRYLRGLVTDFKLEEVYRNLYTDAKFMEVQRECKRLMYCNGSSQRTVMDGVVEHLIDDCVYVYCHSTRKDKPINKRRSYRVIFYDETKEVQCECKLFECHGILCKHCMKVLDLQQVVEVPEKYIFCLLYTSPSPRD